LVSAWHIPNGDHVLMCIARVISFERALGTLRHPRFGGRGRSRDTWRWVLSALNRGMPSAKRKSGRSLTEEERGTQQFKIRLDYITLAHLRMLANSRKKSRTKYIEDLIDREWDVRESGSRERNKVEVRLLGVDRLYLDGACLGLGIKIPKWGKPLDIKMAEKNGKRFLRDRHPDKLNQNYNKDAYLEVGKWLDVVRKYNAAVSNAFEGHEPVDSSS
jgi:hypothetical protein